jgi:hypothetical protein
MKRNGEYASVLYQCEFDELNAPIYADASQYTDCCLYGGYNFFGNISDKPIKITKY